LKTGWGFKVRTIIETSFGVNIGFTSIGAGRYLAV
jgi:hypothetical protein